MWSHSGEGVNQKVTAILPTNFFEGVGAPSSVFEDSWRRHVKVKQVFFFAPMLWSCHRQKNRPAPGKGGGLWHFWILKASVLKLQLSFMTHDCSDNFVPPAENDQGVMMFREKPPVMLTFWGEETVLVSQDHVLLSRSQPPLDAWRNQDNWLLAMIRVLWIISDETQGCPAIGLCYGALEAVLEMETSQRRWIIFCLCPWVTVLKVPFVYHTVRVQQRTLPCVVTDKQWGLVCYAA